MDYYKIIKSIINQLKSDIIPAPADYNMSDEQFAKIIYAMRDNNLLLNTHIIKNSSGVPVKAIMESTILSVDGLLF